ncbi:hypothetical protein HPB52_010672 [Rhipicephalus sanguineus]|uniref:2',3'-cyclic-nucleotide 3'-phosphodiesterase n=1 Tax=Rhipicephalus sanguineus TaxID=34632 RepID=A0A9D4SWG7_RHISA|nr:hypothetical protein HPB52_010672 [Rhipicephalus sanguineus]
MLVILHSVVRRLLLDPSTPEPKEPDHGVEPKTFHRWGIPTSDVDSSGMYLIYVVGVVAADKTLFTDDVLDVLDVAEFLDSVDFPCLVDDDTMEFLRSHGRILFLSRGPPGSGKGTVASKLLELYPGSRICWSHNMFLDPLAPPRTEETLRQSHDLCRQKITEYMQQNVPVIINKNTNMMMWEMSNFLRMAATYGYTVIILDVNKNFVMKPED